VRTQLSDFFLTKKLILSTIIGATIVSLFNFFLQFHSTKVKHGRGQAAEARTAAQVAERQRG
jgi:hypothetical protein